MLFYMGFLIDYKSEGVGALGIVVIVELKNLGGNLYFFGN